MKQTLSQACYRYDSALAALAPLVHRKTSQLEDPGVVSLGLFVSYKVLKRVPPQHTVSLCAKG
jgi:hypothetical protein